MAAKPSSSSPIDKVSKQQRTMNNNHGSNQKCHMKEEIMASVMLSSCCANPTTGNNAADNNNLQKIHPSEEKPMSVATMTMLSPGEVERASSRAGGNFLCSEKMMSREQQQTRSGGSGEADRRGSSHSDFPTIGTGRSELFGRMALPSCSGQQYMNNNKNNDPSQSSSNKNSSSRRRFNKPFASSPLIDRGDSLVQRQSSLLSLLASDTMETAATYNTPKKKSNDSSCCSATVATDSYATPIRSSSHSSLSVMMPDSPAMELSMAKQVANRAQMSNARMNNREMLRNYRTTTPDPLHSPTKKSRGTAGGGSNSTGSPRSSAPRERGDGESSSVVTSNNTIDAPTRVDKPYSSFENAPLPPVWEATGEGVNTELASTYHYPRLYLRDPSRIIMEHGETLLTTTGNRRGLWWFHLAQQMETTLKHVQDDHWNALLVSQQQQQSRNTNNNNGISTSDSISAASSSVQHQQPIPFGCAGLENDAGDGCVAMRDLCLGKQGQKQPLTQHRPSSKSLSSRHKQKKGTAAATSTFSPAASPVNVWSEPSASTIKVRGKNYSKDGIKVESETSMFSVMGVDSFVNQGFGGKGGGGGVCDEEEEGVPLSSLGTNHYLRRWRRVCEEMGLDRPPFLLIINFIVPWGNFQAYLIRPDADEGPFVSRHKNRPSEKAWREFMDGTTEYRNKRLKLIPRVCAGPWMVKKMVGSTPALIGTKLPVSYRGSLRENYLEINLDVTKGPAFGNSVANTVVGKADVVTVDLGLVIEGQEEDGHLPEQMLGLVRLHHLDMKKAPTYSQWKQELLER